MRRLVGAPWAAGLLLSAVMVPGQVPAPTPHDYRGPQVRVDGIFVTPVPNAPFAATVEIVSHQKLPDGTEHVVTTRNHIARSSSGRIRNERRQLVSASFKGEPRLLSVHLYDPASRKSTFFDPDTRLARETILPAPPVIPAGQRPPGAAAAVPGAVPGVTETDLGAQSLDGVLLQGKRKTQVIPAESSGTGQAVEVTDDYWYSPDLSVYLIIKHNDPRSGEQIVAVTQIERGEPPATDMTVPPEYKIVDETPPPRPSPGGPEQPAAHP